MQVPQKEALNGVRSVEHPQASQYDSQGRRTGQKTSYFSWWAVLDSDGKRILSDYVKVLEQVEKTGKLQIYGEVTTSSREINNVVFEAKKQPNGTVTVTLEDNTEVCLYPNSQNRADTICSFWITDQDAEKDLLFSEIEFDENNEFASESEDLIEIHGQYLDGREINATVTKIICLDDRLGSCLAVGAGQRYILGSPITDRAVIKAYRTRYH